MTSGRAYIGFKYANSIRRTYYSSHTNHVVEKYNYKRIRVCVCVCHSCRSRAQWNGRIFPDTNFLNMKHKLDYKVERTNELHACSRT